jgi:putative DNA primase/helicase
MAATYPAPRRQRPDAPVARPIIVRMSDVQPRPVSWLWPDVAPMGRLTLLSGEPGIGKSVLALDMAARVSRGLPWPASERKAPQGNVVLLSPHDHPEETVRSRLKAAGGDADKVFRLSRLHEFRPDEPGPFSFPKDLPVLDRAIEAIGDVRLIVVDPLSACVGGSTRSAAYRNTLTGLADLAARTGAAVVAVARFSGTPGTAAFRRSSSNAEALTAAKSVWRLTRDRKDPDRVLLLPVKCNLTKPETGRAFKVETSADRSGPALGWESEPVPQAHGKPVGDEPEAGEPAKDVEERRPQRQRKSKAARWLHQTLSVRPRDAGQLRKLAARQGIKGRELKKARESERIVEVRDGSTGRVLWALPAGGMSGQRAGDAADAAGQRGADVRGGSTGPVAEAPRKDEVPGQGADRAAGAGVGRAGAVVEAAACS